MNQKDTPTEYAIYVSEPTKRRLVQAYWMQAREAMSAGEFDPDAQRHIAYAYAAYLLLTVWERLPERYDSKAIDDWMASFANELAGIAEAVARESGKEVSA